MSIYSRVHNPNWKKVKIVDHGKISPNEKLMYECATKYYHAFDVGLDGLVMTDELNNPNFMEIVDNIKNALPYDYHNDRSDSPGENRNL